MYVTPVTYYNIYFEIHAYIDGDEWSTAELITNPHSTQNTQNTKKSSKKTLHYFASQDLLRAFQNFDVRLR